MTFPAIRCVTLFACWCVFKPAPADAARGSAGYEILAESAGAGGAEAVSSADYSGDGGFGAISGISEASVSGITVKHGFGGQLYEITTLRVSAPAAAVAEHQTLQLAALALLDDLTSLALSASALEWSVVEGPVAAVSSTGLLTAGDVSQNTAARVRGDFAGFSATFDLTVLDASGGPVLFPDIAVEQPAGTELFTGASRDFGTVTEGVARDMGFLVKNTGAAPLEGFIFTFSGPDAARFSAPVIPGSPVAAGEFTEFVVRFTPSGGGLRTAELRIGSNDPDENPFVIQLSATGNQPPLFTGYSFGTTVNRGVAVAVAKLLARVADADGDLATLTAVSATTAAGGEASLGGQEIFYQPPPAFTGGDSFEVTFSDGRGGVASGVVTVNVFSGDELGSNVISLEFPPGGGVRGVFAGVPGRTYQLQRSVNLDAWTVVRTITATELGEIFFTDDDAPENRAFYRTRVLP